MRVLVVGINYAPERISVGPFTTGLCEWLVECGHEVSVVTAFPYYPQWRVWEGYRGSFYRREVINGVTVHRVAHYVPATASNLLQRLAYDFSFTLNSLLVGLFAGKCDVVYCSCPPPTVALTAWTVGILKRAPHIIKLTDLASDAALATGIMREGWLARAARGLERFMYDRADGIVCLCDGFIEKLKARGVNPSKISLIPDWGDTEGVRPLSGDRRFRIAHQIPLDAFVVLHSGNMGKKQNLLNVIEAADLTREDSTIRWVLVGEGEERSLLEAEIARRQLPNLQMLPLQPATEMAEMYASADLLLLNQTAAMEGAVIPSKLLTYMSAGRSILAAVNEKSEAARIVRQAQCGQVVPAENPGELVNAVRALRNSPSLIQQNGDNARNYALLNFTKAAVLQKYRDLFQRWDFSGASGFLAPESR